MAKKPTKKQAPKVHLMMMRLSPEDYQKLEQLANAQELPARKIDVIRLLVRRAWSTKFNSTV